MFCPQPRKSKYLTKLPISGNPDIDRGPLHSFMAAVLPTASREGGGGGMAVCIRVPPCFGSSKRLRTEMLWETALLRGPLWPNVNYVECNASGQVMLGQIVKPICEELMIKLVAPGMKMQYTDPEGPTPLTLVACHPGWDDYLDLGESVNDMAQRLIEEDAQREQASSTASATPRLTDTGQITPIPPDRTVMVPAVEFLGSQLAGSSCDNTVHLSDTTDASASSSRPTKDVDTEDEATILGHFSDALREMANSIVGLEDGYFKALCEVIVETEKALWDLSYIDAHYASHVVTVMSLWQEAVQMAASHMEGVDITTYLTRQEDMWRATHEYVKAVVQAREECKATHAKEQEKRKQAIKANDYEDPVICLLHVTCKVAHAQCEKAVDAFINSIKATLHKHIPVHVQGPLIANALSMAFQFQMAIWRMVGEECVCPIRSKHLDWCGLAGIIQAIVETFPKNCALMFPPAPASAAPTSFSSTFKPASSHEDNDDDDMLGAGGDFHRFETSTPMPSDSGRGSAGAFSRTPYFTSGPLPYGGAFIMASDNTGAPSGASQVHVAKRGDRGRGAIDEELDLGIEADDEADGDKEAAEDTADNPPIDPNKIKLLKTIIKVPSGSQPSTAPKSGNKRGSTHLDGGSGSLESSAEDLDASRSSTWPKKKGGTPTKVTSPNQWSKADVDIVHQIQYKTDFKHFQTYRTNKIAPADLACINIVDHSAYLEVVHADPSLVIPKSVFSVAAYRATLEQQGSNVAKFDKEVGTNYKKGAKGSWAPDSEKVHID